MNRLQHLLAFCEEDPADPFNWYGLALEYQKTDPVKAGETFDLLLRDFPRYIPTYYHAAQHWADAGDEAKARSVYEKGISEATAARDAHALRELRSALMRWEEEWE